MSNFLAITLDENTVPLAQEIAVQLGYVEAQVVQGSIADGVAHIESSGVSPLYVFVDIGSQIDGVNEQLEQLAQYCEARTKVVIIGDFNDLNLYRQLIQKGVTEYFVKPVNAKDIKEAFLKNSQDSLSASEDASGRVVSVMSASSGDGSTTIATNLGYSLASEYKLPTVIVDMDYQYGLVARNLDLTPSAGIKELYDHPEGSIDQTLLETTITRYSDNLHVIAAPRVLDFIPDISNNVMTNLIHTLRKKFKFVILDLPHEWSDSLSVLLKEVDKNLLVGQLSIKSVTHTSRILDAFQARGVQVNNSSLIINRSGSKFKEPITSNDFAMACKKKVEFYVSNDSKVMSSAEDKGITAIETGNNVLNKQFKEIAESLLNIQTRG